MRVLMLSPAFPPEITGSGHLYYELALSLRARGHHVTVITAQPRQRLGEQAIRGPGRRRLVERLTVDGIDVVRPRTLPLPLDRPLFKGLDHFAVAASYLVAAPAVARPDIILVYSPPLTLGLTALALGRAWRAPVVFNAQDMFPQYAIDIGVLRSRAMIRVLRAIERMIYRRSARIVVHSEGNRDFLARNAVARDKVAVVPNWADTERLKPGLVDMAFRHAHGLADRFVVSYAGTMGWAQRLDMVIEAAHHLRENPKMVFVLVGDGPQRKSLVTRAGELGVSNVRFLPLLPREAYPGLLAASDVCLISLDGRISTPVVPGKLLDIMAAGRPVVASVPMDGDAARIIQAGECGLVVPPDAPDALARAVMQLHARPDLRETFGKNGRFHVERFYSRLVCTAAWERVLVGVASGTPEDREPVVVRG